MARTSKAKASRSRVLADALGSLGCPGHVNLFSELEAEERHDPAVVLLACLACDELDTRVVEWLPWLVLRFEHLDWHWIVSEARSRNVQNRLGFIVSLALRIGATGGGNVEQLMKLSAVEEQLFELRNDKEDTLCQASLSSSERKWLREMRTEEARQWNLLTTLSERELRYGAEL